MDDNSRLKVEFPLGELTVVVEQPTPEQLFVLALSRQPKTDQEQGRLVDRVVRVMEKITGDQWYDVIEAGLINEQITVSQLMELVGDVLQFEWAKYAAPDEVPAGTHLGTDEPLTTVVPDMRPAPRVVGRG